MSWTAEFCNTISVKTVLFIRITLVNVKERTPVFRSKLKSLSSGIVSSVVRLDLIILSASSLEITIAIFPFVSLMANSVILTYVVDTLEPIVICSCRRRKSSAVRVMETVVLEIADATPFCSVNDLAPKVELFLVSCSVMAIMLNVSTSTVSEKLNSSIPSSISSENSTRSGPVLSGITFIICSLLTGSSGLPKKSKRLVD